MTKDELEKRHERAQRETFIISKTDDGYRVYSPEKPTKSFTVSGSPEEPSFSCLDFQTHEGDRQWRCKHILAVLNQFYKGNGRSDESLSLRPFMPFFQLILHPVPLQRLSQDQGLHPFALMALPCGFPCVS